MKDLYSDCLTFGLTFFLHLKKLKFEVGEYPLRMWFMQGRRLGTPYCGHEIKQGVLSLCNKWWINVLLIKLK